MPSVIKLMDYRRWFALGMMAVMVAVWAYLLLTPIPQLPISGANGEYANSCCGPIILNDGQLSVGTQHITYVIESDKEGPYILTAGYVGVGNGGIEIDRKSYPLKMYLDKPTNPEVVTIASRTGEFQFRRVKPNGG